MDVCWALIAYVNGNCNASLTLCVGKYCGQPARHFPRQFAHIPRPKVVRNADALAGVQF